MKTLLLIITTILILPQALPARGLSRAAKSVGKALEKEAVASSSSAAAAAGAAALSSKKVGNTLSTQSQKSLETAQEKQAHEDAILRGQLLGGEAFPSSLAWKNAKNKKLLQKPNLQWAPAKRLSKEERRINIPLSTALLLKYKEPIIKSYALTDSYLEGYYLRRIYPYLSKPSFLAEKNGHMYRGVFMTVDELASTLQNGFLTSMNTWNVGAKNKGDQFVSFSSSTGEALSYVFQGGGNREHPNGIGVVFEVDSDIKGLEYWEDEVHNSTHTIYHCYENVPPEKIRNVYIYGQYGLESLPEIIIKARRNALPNRERWIHDFDSRFLR